MTQAELRRLVPDAPESITEILDAARGTIEPPNRSEIFGPERFAQHGRSLGQTHRAEVARHRSAAFFPRLQENIRTLREAQHYIGAQASTGYQVTPAAEWLLDNFHLIEGQLKEIREGLPRSYFRGLPVLIDEPLKGLPRIYGVAWAYVAHTDGAFDEDLLAHFLGPTEPLPSDLLASLRSRAWTGNVRELRNFVARMPCPPPCASCWSKTCGAWPNAWPRPRRRASWPTSWRTASRPTPRTASTSCWHC